MMMNRTRAAADKLVAHRGRTPTLTAAAGVLMLIAVLLNLVGFVQAFSIHRQHQVVGRQSRTTSTLVLPYCSSSFFTQGAAKSTTTNTALFYQDDDNGSSNPQQQQQRQGRSKNAIPILGPARPGQAPLLVGAELVIQHPTDSQWQALEETVRIHQQHVQQHDDNKDGEPHPNANSGIHAAPMIAILDEYTTTTSRARSSKGRYATIAAVVGISTTSSSDNNRKDGIIDTSDDNTRFMESLQRLGGPSDSSLLNRDELQVRLLGVGRAILSDFFQQVPSHHYDDEGHLLTPDGNLMSDAEHNHHLKDDQQHANHNNIIMANFGLVLDQQTRGSPVHALHKMSGLTFKIQSLHEDRRKLVAGIKAAKARLAHAAWKRRQEAQQQDLTTDEEELQDFDGLGLLFETKASLPTTTTMPQSVTLTYEWNATTAAYEKTTETDSSSSAPEEQMSSVQQQQQDESGGPLAKLNNYGLGTSACSLAKIGDLCQQVYLPKLQPYYSPERCQTEEHYYEVYSFVATTALDAYLTKAELGWALQCTNTVERLEQVYDWMWRHKRELQAVADQVNDQLKDCGEECTDLW